jgi:hypothetical protein
MLLVVIGTDSEGEADVLYAYIASGSMMKGFLLNQAIQTIDHQKETASFLKNFLTFK